MQAMQGFHKNGVITLDEPLSVGDGRVVVYVIQPQDNSPRILREPIPGKPTLIGLWDGEVTIPDDFNEPLDDLKEYMY